jgi:hypothetical protein
MNEHQPYGDVRKLALLAREEIQRQNRLLNETDQLLRGSHHLLSRSQELIRDLSCGRYQLNDVHEGRTNEDSVSATANSKIRK